jgi:hypothetical protein
MSRFTKSSKRAYLALFFFLLSACSPCCNLWIGDESIAANQSMSSARVYLCSANEFAGLELEFVRTLDGLRLYINVYGLEIPTDDEEESTSNVYVSFRDHSYTVSAKRFLGGQRLLLPECTLYEIVHYLECDQPVFIQVGRYQADIYPGNFIPVYNRMVSCCF